MGMNNKHPQPTPVPDPPDPRYRSSQTWPVANSHETTHQPGPGRSLTAYDH